jgi:hypothetical protein
MKKIIIVDVPDGYYVGTVNLIPNNKNSSKWSINGDCKELTLPTDDEIEKDNFTEGDEYAEQSYLLSEGAKWLKYKILEEL